MLITRDTELIYRNEAGAEILFSPFSAYYPEEVTEEVKNKINTQKTNLLHGNALVSCTLESRYITISGFIERTGAVAALREKLIQAVNPTLKGMLIHNNQMEQREIEVIAEDIPTVVAAGGMIRYDIKLQACNPFWQNKEKVEQLALLTPKLAFPLVIPYGRGIVFGSKKSVLENEVINLGDTESGFRVIFKARGNVVNPEIYNKLTGERIKIHYVMAKGEVIEVINYPEKKKITLNQMDNGFKYLDVESAFFHLKVGKNIIGYIAEENTVNLEVILYYTPRYLGV